jgi:hypothetical protein
MFVLLAEQILLSRSYPQLEFWTLCASDCLQDLDPSSITPRFSHGSYHFRLFEMTDLLLALQTIITKQLHVRFTGTPPLMSYWMRERLGHTSGRIDFEMYFHDDNTCEWARDLSNDHWETWYTTMRMTAFRAKHHGMVRPSYSSHIERHVKDPENMCSQMSRR